MECYGAVLDIFFEEKTVCFSGETSCNVCLNTMNNPRFYIKIWFAGVLRYMDGVNMFMLLSEKMKNSLVSHVNNNAEEKSAKILQILTNRTPVARITSCSKLQAELVEDALVDMEVVTMKKALTSIGIEEDNKQGYNKKKKEIHIDNKDV